MSYIPFDQLPDSSRLWIFASDRTVSEAEAELLEREMQSFCNSWLAHGSAVTASAGMRYCQFLLIAADDRTFPSGCSTDEMFRRVRTIGETYGADFFGLPRVQFKESGTIRSVVRFEFDTMAKTLPKTTVVFDNTLTTLGDLRAGKWEIPARNSWHAKAFEFQEHKK